jgi:ketosteroid isomerase-like protein
MMERKDFENWVRGYIAAWKSNDAKDIAALFTQDAIYSTGPFDEPWVGQQAILDGWIGIGDQPGDWTFEYEVLAVDGDLGVMHGNTVYKESGTFSNIWLIRLTDDGRCKEFREWFVRKRD